MRMVKRALLCVGLAAALLVPGTAQASTPINVQVLVGDSCVSGTGPANAHVSAVLRTPDGRVRDNFTTMSDDTGAWGSCFSLALPSTFINGNDILKIVVGNKSRTMVVPNVVPAIDRVADTITGTVGANSLVDVEVAHHRDLKHTRQFSFTAVADSQGAWSVDTTGTVNLLGADQVIAITAVGNDLFGGLVQVPFVQLTNVDNILDGAANTGANLSFDLFDGHGHIKASTTTSALAFGQYEVSLYDGNGNAAYPVGGDQLVSNFATDATLTLPVSELRGSASSDTISGRCMANAHYAVLTYNNTYFGRTDSTGRLSLSVGNKENLHRADPLRLVCQYPTGDLWIRTGKVN